MRIASGVGLMIEVIEQNVTDALGNVFEAYNNIHFISNFLNLFWCSKDGESVSLGIRQSVASTAKWIGDHYWFIQSYRVDLPVFMTEALHKHSAPH